VAKEGVVMAKHMVAVAKKQDCGSKQRIVLAKKRDFDGQVGKSKWLRRKFVMAEQAGYDGQEEGL
jgi:hypothetical protein